MRRGPSFFVRPCHWLLASSSVSRMRNLIRESYFSFECESSSNLVRYREDASWLRFPFCVTGDSSGHITGSEPPLRHHTTSLSVLTAGHVAY
jgi:hypothetical protein